MKNAFCWTVLGLVSLFVASFLAAKTERASTCAICREGRTEWDYLGLRWSRRTGTDLSRWYAARVEPEHAHLWERSPCSYETNIWGSSLGSACRAERPPIWALPPATQKAVYMKFADPLAAKALFAGLARARDGDEGRRVVRALGEGESAGFPVPGDDWWAARSSRPAPRPFASGPAAPL